MHFVGLLPATANCQSASCHAILRSKNMIESIDNLITEYTADLEAASSPIVARIVSDRIANDVVLIKSNLNHYKTSKRYGQVNDKFNHLVFKLDQLKFHTKSQLSQEAVQPTGERSESISSEITIKPVTYSTAVKTNDINELRSRLFSNNNSDLTNDYHDSIQQDLISDLSNLASDLKKGAISLSYKILDDSHLLSNTQNNLNKNNDMIGVVGDNLNNYLLNKTGGKISFWFLIKVAVFITAVFIAILILINLVPRF